jgi:class 3 adenylate cyclase
VRTVRRSDADRPSDTGVRSGAMTGSEAERRIVTVIFCDLVGFTSLSERLDAEDVSIVQDAYFSAVKDAVARYGGQLEKFIGDAAVAIFGTPASRDDDAERGVRCGLAIAGALQQVCARLGMDEDVLRVRVGVNTGEAVVHPDPTPGEPIVTGDTVNIAARLQSAAAPGAVLVGPTTALAVADAIELVDAQVLELKGKAHPVRASLAVSTRPERSRDHAMGALRAPMLGRDAELARLFRTLDAVASGKARRITMVAPPGVGKTRLTAEFGAQAAMQGASVRRARLRPDVLAPYGAVADLLVAAFASVASNTSLDVAAGREVLRAALAGAGLAPERAEVVIAESLAVAWPPTDSGDAVDTADRRDTLFVSWREALGSLGDGPEVWIVEDVHWSGGDLLAFLDGSGAGETARGRLVLATARPSLLDTAGWWAQGADLIHLAPLGAMDAGQLVRALVGDAVPDELVSVIAERSDGNALFIEELLRTWVSTGILGLDGAVWRLTTSAADVPLPETVQAIYAAQLDDLPAPARRVARTASVAGRRFPVTALEPLGVPHAVAGLDVLARRALISGPISEPLLGDTFSFRHALLRDAGYASLARAERAQLHIRMARWLTGAAGDRAGEAAEVIGRHYAAALDQAPGLASDVGEGLSRDETAALASSWFERGAETAISLAAHEAAAALLRHALDLTAEGDALARARRLVALARATAFVSDMDEGTRLAREALDLLRGVVVAESATAGVREAVAATTWLLCRILAQQLRFHEVVDLAERGLAEIGEADDVPTGRLVVARGLGRAMISDEELASNEQGSLERVIAIARAAGDRNLELDAHMWLSLDQGDDPHWRRVAEIALELGRLDAAALALRVLSALTLPDRPDEGIQRVADAATFAVAHGLTEDLAWSDYLQSELLLLRGDWDAAWTCATRAIEVGIDNAYHRVTVRSWHVATLIADARGDADTVQRARAWYDARRDDFPDSPYGRLSQTQVDLLVARARGSAGPAADITRLSASFTEDMTLPSWFAAVDLIVSTWIARRELNEARAACRPSSRPSRRAEERSVTPWGYCSAPESRATTTTSAARSRGSARPRRRGGSRRRCGSSPTRGRRPRLSSTRPRRSNVASASVLPPVELLGPLDAEADPDLRVVLGDRPVLHDGARAEDVHGLDAADRLGRLRQRLLSGVAPGLRRDADQVDRLDDRHPYPPL